MKKLSDEAKVDSLIKKWVFDKDDWNIGWLIALGVILVFQFAELDEQLVAKMNSTSLESEFFRDSFVAPYMGPILFVLGHPFLFALLVPIFFPFKRRSEFYFGLSFDGMETVKKVQELPLRVFIKWPEITKVSKANYRRRKLLVLSSPEGEIGELIWDIPRDHKRAMKLLVDGWLESDHALKKFLEKDMK